MKDILNIGGEILKISFTVILNIYSMMILGIIYMQLAKKIEKKSLDNKIFKAIVLSTFVLLFIEILSRFDGNYMPIHPYMNNIGNFMIFSLMLLLPSLWVLYIHYNIFREESRTKKLIYPLIVINLLNLAITIWTQFGQGYYYIDKSNTYNRGPLFPILMICIVGLLLVTFLLIILNKDKIEEKYYIPLVFFSIPPAIGIVLQVKFQNVPTILNSMIFSILIIFLNIQNDMMYRDHLTGVSNRKKLENYLRDKIEKSEASKTFSAIMIDLNDFKSINDNYGHDVGDRVLKETARLLEKCVRTKDLVSRFGGDEFYIVLEIYDINKLKEVVERIKNNFKNYNKYSGEEYDIDFSIGYDIYDYNSKMTVKEFQSHIDSLMYENKKAIKKDT